MHESEIGAFSVPPLEVADQILTWVEESLPASPGVEARDRNDSLLCAAYGRAYRCFKSLRDLAAPPRYEADVRGFSTGPCSVSRSGRFG